MDKIWKMLTFDSSPLRVVWDTSEWSRDAPMWFCKLLSPRVFLRRKWFCFFIVLFVGFFAINVLLIAYNIDLRSRLPTTSTFQSAPVKQEEISPGTPKIENLTSEQDILSETVEKCELGKDPLSTSAYDRMKTEVCRSRMTAFLCNMNRTVGWPVEEVHNTCTVMFNKSRMYTYIGCFEDSTTSRLLQGFKYELKTTNSPSMCVQTCFRAGFIYAGVEYGSQCFCGSELAANSQKRRINDEKCQSNACPVVNELYCGGFNALALYNTGVIAAERRLPIYQVPAHLNGDNRMAETIPTPPRILFLLQLNGRNSQQIRRLLKLIYRPHHFYYVHVDARQQYMQKEMISVEETLRSMDLHNFQVARDTMRYSTIWGGASLLEMFLRVIRTTLSVKTKNWSSWDYILNLSETDMPLLSLEELEYNLLINMGKSFLSSHGYNTASFVQKQGFNYIFMECEDRMWRIGLRKNFPRNLRLDGGSDWVIIHKDLAAFAVDESNELAVQLKKLFSTILLPLESFFHTLALNSEFCTRILYRNLRLTNWRRKQGCRCAWLRHVVDWCGCSPLAIRHDERRFDIQKCKTRLHFFARKFDSAIDSEAIVLAERQVLRFHSKPWRQSLEMSVSFNATWQNLYLADVDATEGSEHTIQLYNNWFRSIAYKSDIIPGCKIGNAIEIFTYKSSSFTPLRIGASAHFICTHEGIANNLLNDKSHPKIEVLTSRNRPNRIADNSFVLANDTIRYWAFTLDRIDFGMSLDLKEDVLRNPLGLIQTNGIISLLWFWSAREFHRGEKLYENLHYMNASKLPVNNTSPPVVIQIWAPSVHHDAAQMVYTKNVPSYDSINFAQNTEVSISDLFHRRPNLVPGIWSAKILSEHGKFLGKIDFPVYPKTMDENFDQFSFMQLTSHFYEIIDVCITLNAAFMKGSLTELPKLCQDTPWSTHFPDLKSEISHGYDDKLAMLI